MIDVLKNGHIKMYTLRMKKILINVLIIICLITPAYASFDDYFDYINGIYESGEPDYADGDLEDKLGDSGYYADLFPEEVFNEDFNSLETQKNNINGTNKYNKPIIDRYGDATSNDFKKRMQENYTYGAIKVGENYYYKNNDGTFKTGWYYEKGKWYYFDPKSCALVKNQLIEYIGQVYYIQNNYIMATNQTIQLGDKVINIDEKGVCRVVEKN